MFARFAFAACALALLSAAGCGPAKLDETTTLTLNSEYGARAVELSPQKKPQKITVEFTSSDGEVSVAVFKEEDAKGEDGLMTAQASKALGNKRGKADSFSVDVPENTAARVIVRHSTAKQTDVKVRVTNKP